MLRITIHNEAVLTRFIIEGKLIGPWVRELESCWRSETAQPAPPRILVELNDVRFVDEEGRRLLALMAASGVELIAVDLQMRAIVEKITEGGRTNEKAE